MKQVGILLFLGSTFLTFGQIRLASHPLELKKAKEYHQIINTSDRQNDNVFVFATDKEKTTILKYSPFLFFKDSMVTKRPDIGYKLMAGYSFGQDENPTVYWADSNFKNIVAVHYDLVAKKTTTNFLQLPLQRETVLHTFNENNNFYILTKKITTEALVLYIFKDGKKTQYLLDFSGFEFVNRKKETINLSTILAVLPLEKIETRAYNPLFKATSKSKFYVRENDILFTFDHNINETQLFQLDFKTLQLVERSIPQFSLKRLNGLSNSYYHENKIYQVAANDEELHFGCKDFETDAVIKEFSVTKNDTITFKNSPLYAQVMNQRPKEIKTTAKFLKQLSATDLGVTVYKTNKNLFLTIGGDVEVEQFSPGFTPNLGDFLSNSYFIPVNVYFESVLDKKGNHIPSKPEPLAVDFMNQFYYENPQATLQSTFKHKKYYISGYYDTKLKQFVMQKFYDGF
ncbi:hypothetical protein ACSVH5_09915 [Flavobacterium sp. RSSA_27]|uniref:hypothetical protein n=1 Tax=Flavobacterium sp. RSSA_27 TaxID=3447667 RepID=UPI003F34BEED